MQQLLQAQRQLERQNAETRDRLAVPARRTGPGQGESGGDRPARRRALLGGNERGGEAHRPDALGEEAVARALAEDDTRAFLQTEPIFHGDQWERAREIAERYRIEYAERREALKRGAPEETR